MAIGTAIGISFKGGGQSWSSYWKSRSKFWSDTFNFTTNVLTDKSGKGNHVPLVGGNCVNFINDVTITMYPAQTGATVTEVNKAGVTTGVTVSSGNIAIDQSALPDAKIYQIKLNNGVEIFLTGGANNYVFATPLIFGKIGGTLNTDWEWSTQNNYFGNLQNGFSKEGLLYNIIKPMNDATWYASAGYTKVSATEVRYDGGNSVAAGQIYHSPTPAKVIGKTYKVKLTVWDSTEDFGDNKIGLRYLTGASSYLYTDDDGVQIQKNGVHYFSFTYAGATDRLSFNTLSAGVDWTGKVIKFRFDWCKETDATILIPAYSTTDACGNTLTHPFIEGYIHEGTDVKLNFSGIAGVTDSNGDPLALSATYTAGTELVNPQFKRIKFSPQLKSIEGEYIVFESFQSGNSLSQLLTYLEEANMLVKTNTNGSVLLIQKWDASYDRVFYFDKKGYNEYYTIQNSQLIANTNQLPVKHEYSALNQSLINDFSDNIGPYNIASVGWCGGTHLYPDSVVPAADWEEILAADNTLDTIDLGDVTEFPDPPVGNKRLVAIMNYVAGAYTPADRVSYTKSGLVLSMTAVRRSNTVDLSGVVIGGATPSQAAYQFKTINIGTPVLSEDHADWTAIKEFSMAVTNVIVDPSQVTKATLLGGDMITQIITHTIHQNAPTVFCDVEETFLQAKTVNTYYGLQFEDRGMTGGKVYFAHGADNTLQDAADQDSGARATYKCEKYIMVETVANNNGKNLSIFIDHDYGTPLANESTEPYFKTPTKTYFTNILNQNKGVGDKVTWRGGYNYFRNKSTTQYILAYYQYENGSLYFIVDFTGSLTFAPSVTEVLTIIAGRKAEITYKDAVITINGVTGSSFTIPNTGLSLTATAAGNIKLRLL